MKLKTLNVLIILSSFFGYLEWGGNNHLFLIQGEALLFSAMLTSPSSVLHPFTVLPFLGQILLLITLFQKTPKRGITYFGISCIGILLLFMFFIGVIGMNMKILFSTLPFVIFSVLSVLEVRKTGLVMKENQSG